MNGLCDNMTHRTDELEAAARNINPESLRAAKSAVAASCAEYVRWADLFSKRLESIEPSELHKFARALVLTMLGHLPTRPETCPFCIQYGRDRECIGCGYALTHGRCDEDTSAFSRFIEAFHELGRAIYLDISDHSSSNRTFDSEQMRTVLREAIFASASEARRMAFDMLHDLTCEPANAPALDLMEQKSKYLKLMIGLLPLKLFSPEVKERCRTVESSLEDYW